MPKNNRRYFVSNHKKIIQSVEFLIGEPKCYYCGYTKLLDVHHSKKDKVAIFLCPNHHQLYIRASKKIGNPYREEESLEETMKLIKEAEEKNKIYKKKIREFDFINVDELEKNNKCYVCNLKNVLDLHHFGKNREKKFDTDRISGSLNLREGIILCHTHHEMYNRITGDIHGVKCNSKEEIIEIIKNIDKNLKTNFFEITKKQRREEYPSYKVSYSKTPKVCPLCGDWYYPGKRVKDICIACAPHEALLPEKTIRAQEEARKYKLFKKNILKYDGGVIKYNDFLNNSDLIKEDIIYFINNKTKVEVIPTIWTYGFGGGSLEFFEENGEEFIGVLSQLESIKMFKKYKEIFFNICQDFERILKNKIYMDVNEFLTRSGYKDDEFYEYIKFCLYEITGVYFSYKNKSISEFYEQCYKWVEDPYLRMGIFGIVEFVEKDKKIQLKNIDLLYCRFEESLKKLYQDSSNIKKSYCIEDLSDFTGLFKDDILKYYNRHLIKLPCSKNEYSSRSLFFYRDSGADIGLQKNQIENLLSFSLIDNERIRALNEKEKIMKNCCEKKKQKIIEILFKQDKKKFNINEVINLTGLTDKEINDSFYSPEDFIKIENKTYIIKLINSNNNISNQKGILIEIHDSFYINIFSINMNPR